MTIEAPPHKQNDVLKERPHSSFRFRFLVDKLVKSAASRTEVTGRENLESLPRNAKVIFATTHITDLDVPAAANALAGDFDLVLGDISQHRHFKVDPITYTGQTLAGRDNFAPIGFHKDAKGNWQADPFDYKDFDPMAKSLENGKAVVIAAHNPSTERQMTDNPGYGAVYLAQKAKDVYIVPVAINIDSHKPVGNANVKNFIETGLARFRTKANVTIGVPYKPEAIDIKAREDILKKRESGQKLDEKDIEVLSTTRSQIKKEATKLMEKLAKMTPEAKRGKWASSTPIPA